jgi:hypothetical protein
VTHSVQIAGKSLPRVVVSPRAGRPEVHIDVPAVVGDFLNDLSTVDLIVELVQNELDAGSPKTTITFEEDALVCEGEGSAIDPQGWERLKYVLGAGGEVPAKIDGIGAKNHGLRAAFLIGNTITVQSSGYRIDLTATGDDTAPDKFYPAVCEFAMRRHLDTARELRFHIELRLSK